MDVDAHRGRGARALLEKCGDTPDSTLLRERGQELGVIGNELGICGARMGGRVVSDQSPDARVSDKIRSE